MKGFLLFLVLGLFETTWSQYEANWDSIDSRPLPVWYDQAKVGIFLHWGVYSVPAYGDAWFWNSWKTSGPDSIFAHFMQNNYYPGFTYQDFGPQFTAEFFDPAQWADLFARAGAKYVVLTSKHHEGYTMWPSKYSFGWNAMDVGPNRDLVGDLATAVKNRGLAFGLYHSLYEWYNPVYMSDKANSWATQEFVDNKVIPEMKEIITAYQPEVLWSDGEWEAPDTYWKSTEFLAWLYNESPVKETVVTNDRWGAGTSCTHGGFMTCADRYNPGYLLPYKWENAMTIDNHGAWAYRRDLNIEDVLTPHELVEALISTVATGGNILINVGPTKEGTIIPIFQERLTQLGSWLDLNGEAIYESTPWVDHQNDTITPGVWYTSKGDTIYATFLNWPTDGVLVLGAVTSLFGGTVSPGVVVLGNEDINIQFAATVEDVRFTLPSSKLNSEWAWILKIAPQA